MDHRSGLIAAVLLSCVGSASAGYAQLSPPAGYSAVADLQSFKSAKSSTFTYSAGRFAASAGLNVGGRVVAFPVSMQMAANAGQYAARFAFGNPLLFAAAAGATIAMPLAAEWLRSKGLTSDGQRWFETLNGIECATNCYRYKGDPSQAEWSYDIHSACTSYWTGKKWMNLPVAIGTNSSGGASPVCHLIVGNPGNTWSQYAAAVAQSIPPYNTTTTREITKTDMENKMAPYPVPVGVPQELEIDWPVQDPVLNPSGEGQPETLRVPMGEPQAVPGSDPQKWSQPVVDAVPSPTATERWRVDLQPKDILKTSPDALAAPVTPPALDPVGQETEKTTPDLCEKNPGILACQKSELGELEPDPVVNENKTFTITPDMGWGPANGGCPAARTIYVQGFAVPMPFDLVCSFASGLRPVVLALAWLGAAFAFIGVARKS